MPGGATGNGTPLQLWDCNGSPAQRISATGLALPLTAGDTVSLRVVTPGFADRRVRHQGGLAYVAPIGAGSAAPVLARG